jgi:GT2 family glycosyltransferase
MYGRPIQYVSLPINRGLPAARNAGSVAATGELLALLDDDDRYLPTHLEHLVAALVQHADAVLAYDDVVIQVEDGTEDDPDPRVMAMCRFGRPYEKAIFDVEDYLITSAIAFRRGDFEAVGKFDESLVSCEDWDLLLRLRDRGELRYVGGAIGVEYSQRLKTADHLGSRFDAGRQAALDLLSARYGLPPLVPKTFLDVVCDLGCVPTPLQRVGDLGTEPDPKP